MAFLSSSSPSIPSAPLRQSKIPNPSLSRLFWHLKLPNPKSQKRRSVRASMEWQEYEDAVREKDLARALRFLKSAESLPVEPSFTSSSPSFSPVSTSGRDLEVLDACLNADDMRLVGRAYAFLKERGFLENFGKCRNIGVLALALFWSGLESSVFGECGLSRFFSWVVEWIDCGLNSILEGTRDVTPIVLKASTGLEASKLSPKKWGTSGSSRATLVAFLGGVSFLVSQGIDIRPNLATILALSLMDSIFLGGSCLAQIFCFWPPYRRRVLVHEAGHLLTAYLMGCPIRGVILDPIVAVQMGIQGQAGTQFWDEKLANELAEGRLSGAAFDRYCMVLFSGIAAEALVYGEAEGGENDENLFRSICVLLQPPLSIAEMSNQARWSILQSYNLLKWHKNAHRAAVKALEGGHSLSTVIRRIEEAMPSSTEPRAMSSVI
ncbi:hypothetical protein QJS10_CPA09g00884 [Acorus calamus]|uniref:ATP-dependent zinc metalloprotease n=1 Tax=Acorus calamus TaxID=4465 RepID=A0AAV9E751_ACOCL|nr:hypothetical protein QJS10_CPA09g00884 [Acorus calamus]